MDAGKTLVIRNQPHVRHSPHHLFSYVRTSSQRPTLSFISYQQLFLKAQDHALPLLHSTFPEPPLITTLDAIRIVVEELWIDWRRTRKREEWSALHSIVEVEVQACHRGKERVAGRALRPSQG